MKNLRIILDLDWKENPIKICLVIKEISFRDVKTTHNAMSKNSIEEQWDWNDLARLLSRIDKWTNKFDTRSLFRCRSLTSITYFPKSRRLVSSWKKTSGRKKKKNKRRGVLSNAKMHTLLWATTVTHCYRCDIQRR